MFHYRVDPERQRVYVLGEGAIDAQSSIDIIQSIADDPQIQPSFVIIADLTLARYERMTGGLSSVVQRLALVKDRYPQAVALVVHPQLQDGPNLVAAATATWSIDMHLCRDVQEAEAWATARLGIP